MTIKSIKILCQIDFPSRTMRLWDGSGPWLDGNGDIWSPLVINEGLDVIESAMNGEAFTLTLGLSGVKEDVANMAFAETEAGDVIGSLVRLMTQDCDENDQAVGAPDVRFTGLLDNIVFDDVADEDGVTSTIAIDCTNRFTTRNQSSGQVLSDVDQKARSARLNPGAPPDRICERITLLADKAIQWPRFAT